MINIYGAVLLVLLMIPNIIYLQKTKGNSNESEHKKITSVEITEQIERYGCIIFLLVNTGLFEYGFASYAAVLIWAVIAALLMAAYYLFWVLLFKKYNEKLCMILLAVIPSVIFIFSGIMMRRMIVVVFGVIFAAAHIYITYNSGKKSRVI